MTYTSEAALQNAAADFLAWSKRARGIFTQTRIEQAAAVIADLLADCAQHKAEATASTNDATRIQREADARERQLLERNRTPAPKPSPRPQLCMAIDCHLMREHFPEECGR